MLKCAKIVFVTGFVLCSLIVSYNGIFGNNTTLRHLVYGTVTLALSVLLLLSKETDFSILKNPLFIAFFVYWFWVTYSICFAVNFGEAVNQSCKVLRDIAFLFCAVNILRRISIGKAVISITIIVGLYSFLEYLVLPVPVRAGFMGMKNLCAASFVLLAALCVYYYKEWKVPSLIAVGLSFFIIISLRARSSWIAIAVASLVFILMNRKYLIQGICGFVIVGCVVFNTMGNSIFNTESLTHRAEMWKQSARMIKDYPAGVGAGCWKLVYPLYLRYSAPQMRQINYTVEDTETNRIWGRPHNDFIQKCAEIGVLGLLSYAILFILALYYSKGVIRLGIVAYIILACFTFPSERAYLTFLLMLFFALALKECEPVEFKFRYVYAVIPVALLVFSVADFVIKHQMSIKVMAIEASRNVEWDKIISVTDNISSLANLDTVGMPLAQYRGIAFGAKKDNKNALKSFKAARKANPNNLHILMNLAAFSVTSGEIREAEEILAKIERMYPDFEDVKKSIKVAERHRLRNILIGMKDG